MISINICRLLNEENQMIKFKYIDEYDLNIFKTVLIMSS